jgi:hypothetical protein
MDTESIWAVFLSGIAIIVLSFLAQNIAAIFIMIFGFIILGLALSGKLGNIILYRFLDLRKIIIAAGFVIISVGAFLIIKNSTANPPPTPTPTPTPTLTTTPTVTSLQAVELINNYLEAKNNIVGGEYSKEDARKYTTGKMYGELIAGSDQKGSIDWLKKNDAYFKFINNKVIESKDFVLSKDNASIKVRVVGRSQYFLNNKEANNKNNNNGKPFNCEYIYNFQPHEGVWKIAERIYIGNCKP